MTRLLFSRMTAALLVFALGGSGYVLLELLWRGHSHISMFFVGGLCCCLLLRLSRAGGPPFLLKCLLGGAVITVVEFISGCVLNLWLGLAVWDYSGLPFQLLGQISLMFTGLWCVLSACVLPLFGLASRTRFLTPNKNGNNNPY